MSLYDFVKGRELASFQEYPFYAIIQAAMRRADTENLKKLQNAWPDVWDELGRRYHAPDGLLEEDSPGD